MVNEVQYERPTCTECAIHWDYDTLTERGELVFSSENDVVLEITCPECDTSNNVFFEYTSTVRDDSN